MIQYYDIIADKSIHNDSLMQDLLPDDYHGFSKGNPKIPDVLSGYDRRIPAGRNTNSVNYNKNLQNYLIADKYRRRSRTQRDQRAYSSMLRAYPTKGYRVYTATQKNKEVRISFSHKDQYDRRK
jgi:hypothetical protein